MASLPILDRTGNEVGQYEIDPALFPQQINKQLLHDAVVMYQANLRQGTHASKSRGMIAGSTKKMYRQKGTGNARAGSRRSPVRRGGGHTFRKDPRDYGYRLPRKALQLATRMAIASRLHDNEVTIVDDLRLDGPKTSEMAGVLKALRCHETTLLLATAGLDRNVYLSARNIRGVTVSPVHELNAHRVLKSRRMLVTRSALDALVEQSQKTKREPATTA